MYTDPDSHNPQHMFTRYRPVKDEQTDGQQNAANSQSYAVQQYDRLKWKTFRDRNLMMLALEVIF